MYNLCPPDRGGNIAGSAQTLLSSSLLQLFLLFLLLLVAVVLMVLQGRLK